MSLFPLTQFDFPNVSAYDSDLREVLHELKLLAANMRDFSAVNKITNDGSWDITKQYKPWTIVSNDNIGYISLRPVPAGIPITNTEYWGMIADYDIIISDLADRINDLEKSVDKLENRFFVFIGDSYSLGTSGGVAVTDFGWVDQVISYLGLAPTQYVRCTLDDLGQRAAFYPTTSDHKSWRDSIQTIYERMTADQKAKVTDVVCCGGYNEIFGNDENLTWQGMESYISFVKDKFPGATYWLGEIGMNTGSDAYCINARNFIVNSVIPLYNYASKLGFKVMSGTNNILWNNTQTTDTVHPTEANYRYIGVAIANNLLGLPSPWLQRNWYTQLTITPASGMSFISPSADYFTINKMNGGRFAVSVSDYLLIEDSDPGAWYPITEHTLGTYDTTYFPKGDKDVWINVPIILTLTNNTSVNATGTLIFNNGTLSMRTNAAVSAPIQRIQIGKFWYYVPKPLVL